MGAVAGWDGAEWAVIYAAVIFGLFLFAVYQLLRAIVDAEDEKLRHERQQSAHVESVRRRLGEDIASLQRQIAELRKDLRK